MWQKTGAACILLNEVARWPSDLTFTINLRLKCKRIRLGSSNNTLITSLHEKSFFAWLLVNPSCDHDVVGVTVCPIFPQYVVHGQWGSWWVGRRVFCFVDWIFGGGDMFNLVMLMSFTGDCSPPLIFRYFHVSFSLSFFFLSLFFLWRWWARSNVRAQTFILLSLLVYSGRSGSKMYGPSNKDCSSFAALGPHSFPLIIAVNLLFFIHTLSLSLPPTH